MDKDCLPVNSTCLPNQSVHLIPEAVSFFAFAISEQNFFFAKFSLASGAGDFLDDEKWGQVYV